MKSLTCCFLLFVLIACSTTTSTESTSTQDSLTVEKTQDSVFVITPVEEPKPGYVEVPADEATVLFDSINAQFEKMHAALADSGNYYIVRLEDYYDEFEGQDQLDQSTWYYDKNLSVVYSLHSHQSGAMDKPDIQEFIIQKDKVIGVKEDGFYEAIINGPAKLLWHNSIGGIQMNYDRLNDKKIVSHYSLKEDYPKDKENDWQVKAILLTSTMEKGKLSKIDEENYTVEIVVPKRNGLEDYTKVWIPKVVYGKLKEDGD